MAHRDLPVAVQQELEFEALLALVADGHHSLQATLAQGNTVNKTKVQRPCLACILAES
jgi:hypothetical protein